MVKMNEEPTHIYVTTGIMLGIGTANDIWRLSLVEIIASMTSEQYREYSVRQYKLCLSMVYGYCI